MTNLQITPTTHSRRRGLISRNITTTTRMIAALPTFAVTAQGCVTDPRQARLVELFASLVALGVSRDALACALESLAEVEA